MSLLIANLLTLLVLCTPSAQASTTYFEAAQQLVEEGKESEARRALQRELILRPNNLDARYDLAVLLERAGHEEDAARLYQENLRRGWHLPSVVNLSQWYVRKGELNRAKALLRKATKHFRHEAVIWYLLAELEAKEGKTQQARALFEKAIQADPLNGFAHLRYARFLHNQGNPEAEKHAERAVRLMEDCAPCWETLGDIRMKKGLTKAALSAYQRAAAIRPTRALRLKIADAYERLGRTDQATRIRTVLRTLNEAPASP